MEFSREEYWTEHRFLSPGDVPDPGIEPRSPASKADSLSSEPHVYDVRAVLSRVRLLL